jgi:hypothetical protein
MSGVFSSLQDVVDMAFQKINSPEVLNITNAIGSIFGTVMLLWITFKSIDIAMGQRRFIISENLHRILMISIITSIAFDTGGWINIILTSVKEFKELAVSGGGAIAQLDGLTDKFNVTIEPIVDDAPLGAGWLIEAIFWLSYFLMICSSLFVLLGGEIILTMALLFTPLAILSLSFDSTKSFFDGWISSVVGSIVTMILAGIILSLMSAVVEAIVLSLGNNEAASYIAAGTSLMFALFFFFFMGEVKNLATALTNFTCGRAVNGLNLAKNLAKLLAI